MKKRYPGPLPFVYDDRELFFGREAEIEYLSTVIVNNKSTVLHGKSGYGKSSLINAGIIPHLLSNFHCEIIRVRFHNRDKNHPVRPIDTLLNTIRQYISGTPYLGEMISAEDPTAWRYFKQLQFEVAKRLTNPDVPELGYILIFDQFEELFTYPKNEVKEFGKELHELLLHRIPEEYQENLKESFKNSDLLERYKDELSILDKDIPVKILFSMRADRFNFLTHLVNYIPNLLSNTYKIKRMDSAQVTEAIIRPALVESNFISPTFRYDDKLVERMLKFLASNPDDEDAEKIEVFEMQIICRKLEEIVADYAASKPSSATQPLLLTEELILGSHFIQDKQAPFKEIIKNYYKETIQAIADPLEQLSARYLIEVKLIDPVTHNRISLDTALVVQTGISLQTQADLIAGRIVRKEVNTVSGKSLELSHDSLVMPILNAAIELGDLNKATMQFFSQALDTAEKIQEDRIRDIIFNVLLEERDPARAAIQVDTDTTAWLRASPLIRESTLTDGNEESIYRFSVKETFQQAAQQSKINSQKSNTKNWVLKFTMASVIFLGIITYMLIERNQTVKTSNKLRALVFLGYVDTIKNKEEALYLTKHIYDEKVLENDDTSLVRVKFSKLLQTQDIQAKESRFNFSINTTNLQSEEIDVSENGDFVVVCDDSDQQQGTGNYVVLNDSGKKIASFKGIMYAYFTNQPDVILLARAAVSSSADSLYNLINKASNRFYLFNCRSKTTDSVNLGNGRYLYELNNAADNLINQKNDSYRARFSAAGNLIIPFYQILPDGRYVQLVRLVSSGKKPVDFPSDGTISSSRDNRNFMTIEVRDRNALKIYNQDGRLLETINGVNFGDFTSDGSLLLINQQVISLRDSAGKTRNYSLPFSPLYAYADQASKWIVAEADGETAIINTGTGEVRRIKQKLADLNFHKNVFITVSGASEADEILPDTITKHSLLNTKSFRYISKEGIQGLKYNRITDQVLFLNNNDQLILLDSAQNIKAGFQLTPNDLFGFSGSGKSFFYVRNDKISVFNNDQKLINFFDFNTSLTWAERLLSATKRKNDTSNLDDELKKKYGLKFQKDFF